MKNLILRFSVAIFALFVLASFVEAQTRLETFAITNAQIATVSGPKLSRGTIVIRNGLIESVGENARVPADARVIDGTGLIIYPGFFDTYTSLGLSLPPTPRPPVLGQPAQQAQQIQVAQTPSNSNYPVGLQPEENVVEQLRGGEAQFETNRNAGFTTVLTVSRDGVFNGQSAVINLAGDSVSAMILRAPFAEHITFTTLRTGGFPGSLMGTFAAIRQMFLDAQRLQEIRKIYDKNPRGIKRPDSDKSLDAVIPILNREMPIVFNANSEIEIVRALNLAKEFNLNAIIAGGQEAWKVADRLKAQNVPILLSLNYPKRTTAASPEADQESLEILRLRAETPKGASRLAQAGVKFAFQSGGMTNINDFLTNANKSVENGLSKDAAIRAMTLSAAEILGVDNRLGSLETGKIANLTVSRGDILAKDKTITHVFVDGKLFEQKEKPKTPAGTQPATGAQPSALAQVGGNYSITIEIPGQPIQATLNLTQQGEILTGNFQSQLGNVPIKDGKVTAEGFTFTATVEFSGSTVELVANGRVTGNQISGTMNAPQGAVPFSGTKTP
ncbi:MAG TPA: amidohydrolase family protein [Pyrinomonadaceae bacterium]|nr:amidohydrolase family protein [Pyrinomonadaceae bacterium]